MFKLTKVRYKQASSVVYSVFATCLWSAKCLCLELLTVGFESFD